MQLKNFGEYHDLYLMRDTLLLADIFENFRQRSMKHYQLDPAHFLTSPALTFNAGLKFTKVELELLTDTEMVGNIFLKIIIILYFLDIIF